MNSKRMHTARIVSMVAVVTLAGTALTGCHRRQPREADFELIDKIATWKLDQVLDKIDATKEQRKEFHAAKDWVLDEVQWMVEQKKARHGEMLSEFLKDDPDPEVLHKMLDARIRDHEAFAHDVLDTLLHLHQQLTPKQRQTLIELVQKRMARHHGHGFGSAFGGPDRSGFGRFGPGHGHRHGKIKSFFKRHFGGLGGRSGD